MSNAQKLPLTKTLSLFGQRKALDEIEKRGHALPGHVISVSGPFVTVNFDLEDATLPQLTLPLASPEYVRLPIQPDDLGWAFPTMAYLGAITGRGGVANLSTLQGNLASLVWFPIANKNWGGTVDPNTLTLYGKTAVKVQDSVSDNAHVIVNGSGITLAFGGHNIVINSTGVFIDGKNFLPHTHSGVQTGSSNTGGVV